MNENKDIKPGRKESPEVGEDGMTAYQRELAEYYEPMHPQKDVSREGLRDCEQEATELQSLLAVFEAEHPLEELHAITDSTEAEVLSHPVRGPAYQAVALILKKLSILKEETNISTQRYDELHIKYLKLSKAVGMISAGKVRHD